MKSVGEKRVVFVTGTSQGIGWSIAKCFLGAGYVVVGCGRRSPDKKTEELTTHFDSYSYVSCDVADLSQIDSAVSGIIKRFGRLDAVVSNAGKNVFKGVDCSLEEWNFNFDLNLRSHWWLAKTCRLELAKRKGAFIVITSNHAFYSIPGAAPYSISKRALVGLVQSMTLDWGRDFRTVGVAPGYIETEGGQRWFDQQEDPVAVRRRVDQMHPVGHIGSGDDVAQLCLFLASEKASFIAGTTITIDGGRSAVMQDL